MFDKFLLTAEAGAEAAAQGGAFTTISSVIMIAAIVAVFYFFMYRPQKKQEKEQKTMRDSLAVGDEITTIGGIIGKVVSIKEETCVIETSGACSKIRILKSAVRSVDVKAEDAD